MTRTISYCQIRLNLCDEKMTSSYLTRYNKTCLGGTYPLGSSFDSSSSCLARSRRSTDGEVIRLALAKLSATANDSFIFSKSAALIRFSSKVIFPNTNAISIRPTSKKNSRPNENLSTMHFLTNLTFE